MPAEDTEQIGIRYETKCRKCGNFHNWSGPAKSPYISLTYQEKINYELEHPPLLQCGVCEKKTVQDVVSYILPEENKGKYPKKNKDT